MTTYLGTPPGQFEAETDTWSSYIERMSHFIDLNEITDANRRRFLLTTSVGKDTFNLLSDLISPQKPHELSFGEISEVLSKHFEPKKLTATERYKYRKLQQQAGQSAAEFTAVLRRAAAKCAFGTTLEENLRDQLVEGIRSEQTRRRMLAEKDLDFAKACEIMQAAELAEQGAKAMQPRQPGAAVAGVDKIQPSSPYKKQKRHFQKPLAVNAQAPQQQSPARRATFARPQQHRFKCDRCNSDDHGPDRCRFKGSDCLSCGRRGHISRACRSKPRRRFNPRTHNVEATEDALSSHFEAQLAIQHLKVACNAAHANNGSTGNEPKMVSIMLNGTPVNLEIDTGSQKTLVNENTWRSLGKPRLEKPNISLISYSWHQVAVAGQCRLQVQTAYQSAELDAFVVKSGSNLLGREWLDKIRLDWSKIFPVKSVQPAALPKLLEKFCEVFQPGLGKLKHIQAKIHIKPGSQPRFHKARPVPFALRKMVEDELDRLEKLGILQRVTSADWAAPIVPVPKANNDGVRVCGDMRCTINPVIATEHYPLPKPSELFHSLNGGERFSKLDLREAYAQVEVDPESRPLLTINTQKGLYQYTRLVYGVSSATAIFQRAIETVLQGLKGVCIYLDDLTVTGRNDKEHLENLEAVLQRLQDYGLRLNQAKCSFMQQTVEYLGFVVDRNGVRPSSNKVKAIVDMPAPSNVSEVRSFNGMIQHYSSFIPSLSSLAAPINALTHKDAPWQWGPAQQKAFNAIKAALLSMDCLVHFDPAVNLTLACDASSTGVGAVLCHRYANGTERPIAFASKSLSPAERNYAQIEREGLSIMFGLRKFNQYLWSRRFTLITDHKPLVSIFSPSKGVSVTALSRLQRWALLLGSYNYDIEFRKTEKHGSADGLSRLTVGPDKQFDSENLSEQIVGQLQVNQVGQLPVDFKRIQAATRQDHRLANVIQLVLQGWPEHFDNPELLPFFRRRAELTVQDGVLLWGLRTIVPEALQPELLQELHKSHSGMVRMKAVARSHFWWPNLDDAIEATARQCAECNSNAKEPPAAAPQPWPFPQQPWQRLHIDFAYPIMGSTYLAVVDAHSKWAEFIEMPRGTTAAQTVSALRQLFATHGLCHTIVADNGPPFGSSEFSDFCAANGITLRQGPPYRPQTNGLAERAVQSFKTAMKPFEALRGLDKEKAISNYLLSYRSTPHATTGSSPAEMLFKRQLRTRLSLVHKSPAAVVENSQQRQIDQRNGSPVIRAFSVNDKVWARSYHGKTKWVPGIVVEVHGSRNYLVKVQAGESNLQWKRHVDQLRSRDDRSSKPAKTSPRSNSAPAAPGQGQEPAAPKAPAASAAPAAPAPTRKTYPLRSRGNAAVNKFIFANFVLAAIVACLGSTTAAALATTTATTTTEAATTTLSPAAELASMYQRLQSYGLELLTATDPRRIKALQYGHDYASREIERLLKIPPRSYEAPPATTTSEGPITADPSTPPPTAPSPTSPVTQQKPPVPASVQPLRNCTASGNATGILSAANVEFCKIVSPSWAVVEQCKQQFYWLLAISLSQAVILIFLIAKLCKSRCCDYRIQISRNRPASPVEPAIQLQPQRQPLLLSSRYC